MPDCGGWGGWEWGYSVGRGIKIVSWVERAERAPGRDADTRVSGRQRGPLLTWESAVNSADAIAWSLGPPS